MTISYRLIADSVSPFDGSVVAAPFVLKIQNNVTSYIIKNSANTDYQVYLAWISEGNTPLPYVPPTPVDHITDLQEAQEVSNSLIITKAHSILSPTDWYITRFTETGVEVPEEITTFRSTIRSEAQSKISTVDSQETLEDLKDYLRSEEYSTWTKL